MPRGLSPTYTPNLLPLVQHPINSFLQLMSPIITPNGSQWQLSEIDKARWGKSWPCLHTFQTTVLNLAAWLLKIYLDSLVGWNGKWRQRLASFVPSKLQCINHCVTIQDFSNENICFYAYDWKRALILTHTILPECIFNYRIQQWYNKEANLCVVYYGIHPKPN